MKKWWPVLWLVILLAVSPVWGQSVTNPYPLRADQLQQTLTNDAAKVPSGAAVTGALGGPISRVGDTNLSPGNINFTVEPAPSAPTAALVSDATGLVTAGVHSVKVAFVTATGTTTVSSASGNVTADASNTKILVTKAADTPSAAVLYWNVYMTAAGGSTYYYVAQVPIATTTYTINVADASLLVTAPTRNLTSGVINNGSGNTFLWLNRGGSGQIRFGDNYAGTTILGKGFDFSHQAASVPSELDVVMIDGASVGMLIKNVRDGSYNSQYIEFATQHGGVSSGTRATIDKDGNFFGPGMNLPHVVNKAASANIRNSHDAEATSTSLSYAKAKTFTLTCGLLGQQRILFDIKTAGGGATAYGKIYRNGVALGTEQTDVTGGYVTKSEDITQTWNPGDTCELWVKTSDAAQAVSVQNFRIAYDDSPTVAVTAATSTP